MQQKGSDQEDSACRKLESAQLRVHRKLLGESNAVAGLAVQGDLCRQSWKRGGKRWKYCLVRDWKKWKRVD